MICGGRWEGASGLVTDVQPFMWLIHVNVWQNQYSILTHIYGIQKDGNDDPVCKTAKETQMYRMDFWTLRERERVG